MLADGGAGIGLGIGSNAAGTLHSLARGSHHIVGDLLVKEEPCKLGIVDKHVSVALVCLNDLVSAHFPGINRVERAPFKKHVNALEHLSDAGCSPLGAPSYPNVKTNSRNVALDVIKRLKVGGVIVAAELSDSRIGTVLCGGAGARFTVLLVTARAVYSRIRGTDVVKVCAAAVGVVTAEGLRPHVLSVPAVVLSSGSGVAGVDKEDSAVLILAVGFDRHITAVIVARNLLMCGLHKSAQLKKQIVRVKLG